jgi:glyoxylase-like metal-dependent hydrolase (beta-lactamase superfamily II)
MPIAFQQEPAGAYGVAHRISPLIRRIVAKNPSPFTYHGTGTYLIGQGEVAVVDPGPALVEHVDALLAVLARSGERISHQLITHTHNDHSPAARLVRERTGAVTYGFGPHAQGRYERGSSVEAGGDLDFIPDVRIGHGDVIEGADWSIECVHTPGHCSNHLCYALREEQVLLTGDHVMGWSTSVISPPDGDMGAYLASLELLLERDDRVYVPTHGPVIESPKPFVRALIEHRKQREQQILACIEAGVHRIAEMVPRMYVGTPALLYPAAARSVFAHVLHMIDRGSLQYEGSEPGLSTSYRRVGQGGHF